MLFCQWSEVINLFLSIVFGVSLSIANHVFNLVFAQSTRRLDNNWKYTKISQIHASLCPLVLIALNNCLV